MHTDYCSAKYVELQPETVMGNRSIPTYVCTAVLDTESWNLVDSKVYKTPTLVPARGGDLSVCYDHDESVNQNYDSVAG